MTGSSTDRGSRISRRTLLKRLAGLGAAGLVLPLPRTALAAVEVARAWRCMGTLIEVRVPDLPVAEAVEAIRQVRRRLRDLEAVWTIYDRNSPLVHFNRSSPKSWVQVPGPTVAAVRTAVEASRRTGGRFDPTVGPVMRAWGLFDGQGRTADRDFLARWRSRPGVDAVEIDDEGRRLRRLDSRVEIDLGGIGKGMAVDEALQQLWAAGSRSALVNLGGSLGTLGAPSSHPQGWPVGIVHPRRDPAFWTEFPLPRGHLATSGDSERWVETPEGPVHHVLDPRTGESAGGISSVTVWAETGTEADVDSTSRFVESSRSGGNVLAQADLPSGERRVLR